MNVQFAFLCDAANISQSNLFNVLGGGIETMEFRQLPAARFLMLLLRLQYHPSTEAGEHAIYVRLLNADGGDLIPQVFITGQFPVGQRSFNVIATLEPRFASYGPHSVEIAVDRLSIASIPLLVIPVVERSEKDLNCA